MKNRPFFSRLSYSLNGIKVAFKGEASFRTQCLFGMIVLLGALILKPKPLWIAILSLTVSLVLSAELMNTALEHVIDRLHPEQHPMIGRAKDCAAGAVLVLSMASLIVGIAFLYDYFI